LPGDVLIQVKPLALEGTAILASEHRDSLIAVVGEAAVAEAENLVWSPGLSVVEPALTLARIDGVHAMHDPTEGGLATGIHEMMQASGTGGHIVEEDIMMLEVTERICSRLGYSPLGIISSGCLLAAVAPASACKALKELRDAGFPAARIGSVTADAGRVEMTTRDGTLIPLPEFAVDELARTP
jgi:hydrogenase maturation factor